MKRGSFRSEALTEARFVAPSYKHVLKKICAGGAFFQNDAELSDGKLASEIKPYKVQFCVTHLFSPTPLLLL